MTDDLRTRIAAVLSYALPDVQCERFLDAADAVIAELDLAIPCAANGCRMRQIARRHSEKSGYLTDSESAE